MNQMCDECLKSIMFNLSQEDMLILSTLKVNNTFNPLLAIDKVKIIPKVEGLTDFKFQMSVSRLEICSLIGRNTAKRPNKFFITSSGVRILELFNQAIKGGK